MSQAEDTLAFQLVAVGISFEREYRFHPERRWRADFLVGDRLLVEIDGVTKGTPGRHQRVDGVKGDCEKLCEAVLAGYDVMRVTPSMVRTGEAVEYIERYMESRRTPSLTACAASN